MFKENELKISLTQEEYDRIAAHADCKPQLQRNYYFDTVDDLSRMVRVREKNGKFALQYKLRERAECNVFTSSEYGREVDGKFLQNAMGVGISKDFVNDAFGCAFAKDLKYLGFGETLRTKFDYFGFVIELDKNIVDSRTDFELEYEGDDDAIADLVRLLESQGVVIKPSCTKYERFLRAKGLMAEKTYNTVLLDLDGTISNTYSGIYKCLKAACSHFGADLDKYNVREFIGPPLSSTFAIIFPDDEETQKAALAYYRKLYIDGGIFDNELYEGIDVFAQTLRQLGVKVGVATSKYERFAVEALDKLGMLRHLDFVCGNDVDRTNKCDVIAYALKTYGIAKDKCLMVGDTFYDLQGAEICGIDAVGVLYGFGKREDMQKYPHIAIVETVDDLQKFVLKRVDKKTL